VLRTLRESKGGAFAVEEEAIRTATFHLASHSGIDAAPEGGCGLEVARLMRARGLVSGEAEVVVFNTGSGASYRW
jgi:threonine synthase